MPSAARGSAQPWPKALGQAGAGAARPTATAAQKRTCIIGTESSTVIVHTSALIRSTHRANPLTCSVGTAANNRDAETLAIATLGRLQPEASSTGDCDNTKHNTKCQLSQATQQPLVHCCSLSNARTQRACTHLVAECRWTRNKGTPPALGPACTECFAMSRTAHTLS